MGAPVTTTPRVGQPVAEGLHYTSRRSALRQAKAWNDILRGDPSGATVTVGGRNAAGRWPLVWGFPNVHLATPAGRTACDAPPPNDRVNGWTAWLTEATCEACLATLSERSRALRASLLSE